MLARQEGAMSSGCCPFCFASGRSSLAGWRRYPVTCDDRISLYPAAPFRLATLLHAWMIAQVGRGSSLVRQTGWASSANPHNSHTSDPPNAPKERRNCKRLTAPVLLPVGEYGALRHEAFFKSAR